MNNEIYLLIYSGAMRAKIDGNIFKVRKNGNNSQFRIEIGEFVFFSLASRSHKCGLQSACHIYRVQYVDSIESQCTFNNRCATVMLGKRVRVLI